MKLETELIEIERSADFKTDAFAIGNLAVIFKILRSKMYSEPIKSVCQEVMSNARDAHSEVGKQHVPINIFLPNDFEPYYKVQDFGPGITPERMSCIVTKYGNSTKRNTNNEDGCFGLGFKSPFAVSHTFTIITTTLEPDGSYLKREYVAYIDETEIGAISEVKVEPGKPEEQGTTVIVPVKSHEIQSYINHTTFITEWWDVKPTTNIELNYLNHPIIHETENYKYVKNLTENYVTINGIPYPLKTYKIFNNNTPKQLYYIKGLIIKFKTGELKVTANREDFDYQPDVINKLQTVINTSLESIYQYKLSELNQANNLVNAYSLYKSLVEFGYQTHFKWGNFTDAKLFDSFKFDGVKCYEYDPSHYSVEPELRYRITVLSPAYETTFYTIKTPVHSLKKVFNDWATTNNIKIIKDETINILKFKSNETFNAFKDKYPEYEYTNPINLDQYFKTIKSTRKTLDEVTLLLRDGKSYNIVEPYSKVTHPALYVLVKQHKLLIGNNLITRKDLVEKLHDIKLPPIYGLTQKQLDKFNHNLINLTDYLTELYEKWSKLELQYSMIKHNFDSISTLNKIKNELKFDHTFNQYYDLLLKCEDVAKKYPNLLSKTNIIARLINKPIINDYHINNTLTTLKNDLRTRYSNFSSLGYSYSLTVLKKEIWNNYLLNLAKLTTEKTDVSQPY